MNTSIEYLLNKAAELEIIEHLQACDADFVPHLSGRVELRSYAQKIISNAIRFEAWYRGTLVGLVAAYCNDREKHIAYITSVSVLKAWMGQGIAANLMGQCVEKAKVLGMRQISLQVACDNTPAVKLYEKSGFFAAKADGPFITMIYTL